MRVIRFMSPVGASPSAATNNLMFVSHSSMEAATFSMLDAAFGFVTAANQYRRTMALSSLIGSARRRHASMPL